MTDTDPGDWIRKALQASRNRNLHLNDPYHAAIARIARKQGWTFDVALNYVVGVGLGVLRTVDKAEKAQPPEPHVIKFHTHAKTDVTDLPPLACATCTCGYTTGLTTGAEATRGAQKHIDAIAEERDQ